MAMPEIPTPKEFRRILRRMDVADRYRLTKVATGGKVADDPEHAALVVAAAQQGLRQTRWLIIVAVALFLIQVASAVSTDDPMLRWFDVATMVVIVAAIAKFFYRDRPRLLRAERLNRELLTSGQDRQG
jgi:hypothetical protein